MSGLRGPQIGLECEPDLWRKGIERLERPLRMHLLLSAVPNLAKLPRALAISGSLTVRSGESRFKCPNVQSLRDNPFSLPETVWC